MARANWTTMPRQRYTTKHAFASAKVAIAIDKPHEQGTIRKNQRCAGIRSFLLIYALMKTQFTIAWNVSAALSEARGSSDSFNRRAYP